MDTFDLGMFLSSWCFILSLVFLILIMLSVYYWSEYHISWKLLNMLVSVTSMMIMLSLLFGLTVCFVLLILRTL